MMDDIRWCLVLGEVVEGSEEDAPVVLIFSGERENMLMVRKRKREKIKDTLNEPLR